MLDSDKDREVNAAWLLHEPERAAISNEIWRGLRAWKRELLPTASIIEGVLKREQLTRSLIEPAIRRRGIARQRKLTELRRLLPGANVKITYKEILEISWLSPKQAILADPQHQGESQDCLLVCYVVAFPPTPQRRTASPVIRHGRRKFPTTPPPASCSVRRRPICARRCSPPGWRFSPPTPQRWCRSLVRMSAFICPLVPVPLEAK
jgi:hypothetical protein